MSDGMMINVFSTKGGVGKTTLAVGLAWALAKDGRVVLVELDSNYSITTLFDIEKGLTISELVRGAPGEIARVGNVDVIVSDGEIAKLEKDLTEGHISLANLWETTQKYDYVVVDNHNSLSMLNVGFLKRGMAVVPFTPTKVALGAYFHTHRILEKMAVRHVGVANRVHRGLFGVPADEKEILHKARVKTHVLDAMLPEIKCVRAGVLCEKFGNYMNKLKEEVIDYGNNRDLGE